MKYYESIWNQFSLHRWNITFSVSSCSFGFPASIHEVNKVRMCRINSELAEQQYQIENSNKMETMDWTLPILFGPWSGIMELWMAVIFWKEIRNEKEINFGIMECRISISRINEYWGLSEYLSSYLWKWWALLGSCICNM